MMTRLGTIVKNLLTAPDGESYAPGRLMGLVLFVVAQAITIYVVTNLGVRQPPITAGEWQVALVALAGWEIAICGSAIGLILGIAPTDTGGKWWGKNASPPPPMPEPSVKGDEENKK